MRLYFFILIVVFVLTACFPGSRSTSATLLVDTNDKLAEQKITRSDSMIFFDDSSFIQLELVLDEITEKEFKMYEDASKRNCDIDSGGFISGYGLSVVTNDCDEICQTFLVDNKDGIKMSLPSNYDAGIIGLAISPSCNQFIVCSSYDGPDYDKYYLHRTQIYGFNIIKGRGLGAIKPFFIVYLNDWSIENFIWISDNSIALKTYEDYNQDNLNYKYFKADLDK